MERQALSRGRVPHSHECERLANTLANIAKGAKTQRQKLQDQAGKKGKNTQELAELIEKAIEKERNLHDLPEIFERSWDG